jgi:hypothetical protein
MLVSRPSVSTRQIPASFRGRRSFIAAEADKFVWNEFNRPKPGPKGKVQGWTFAIQCLCLIRVTTKALDSELRLRTRPE